MKLMKLQRPTFTAWPSVGRLADLRDEIDRLFDSPLNGFGSIYQSLGDWSPALDIHEDKENFVVKAELPGIKKEDVNVSYQDGCLTITLPKTEEAKPKQIDISVN
jgi:HSP20 family protein